MPTPFDFVNSINNKSGNMLDEAPELAREYEPFIVNKALSFFSDTVLLANMLNVYPNLPGKAQYDFLYSVVSRRKRFGGKWPKKQENENVQRIAEFYNVNTSAAIKYLQVLTKDQIDTLMRDLDEGGADVRSKAKKPR